MKDVRFYRMYAHYRNDASPCVYYIAAKSPKDAREKFSSSYPWLKVFAVVKVSETEYWENKGR